MCGEKLACNLLGYIDVGSPPRVRGKGNSNTGSAFSVGITPACAGKRQGREQAEGYRRDHPRVCGEKAKVIAVVTLVLGSPPRVRGKVTTGYRSQSSGRITPACAGKSGLDAEDFHLV